GRRRQRQPARQVQADARPGPHLARRLRRRQAPRARARLVTAPPKDRRHMTAQPPPGPPGGQYPPGGNGAPWPAGPNAPGGTGWAGHPGAPAQPGQPVPPPQPAAPGTLPHPYENAPQTAQGMIDSVTAQGLPPDYAPPAAPGGLVNPHGSAQGPAVAPPQ